MPWPTGCLTVSSTAHLLRPLCSGLLSGKSGRRKVLASESKRMATWAEVNYRMNVAGRTFNTLFGPDFGSIIPIYRTKVCACDAYIHACMSAEAARLSCCVLRRLV